jgi:acid phosphatase (class B)
MDFRHHHRTFATLLLAVLVATGAGCAHLGDAKQGAQAPPYRSISLAQLEASLPAAPIAVGFDIDDTLLFSSPGFYYVLYNTDGPGGTNRYGKDRRAIVANPQTWTDLHENYDRFALPKQIARDVIHLHKRRGDRIYAITARAGVKGDLLDARVRKTFDVALAEPVIFTAFKPKTEVIRSRGIVVYYGDSDSDIQDAKEAGARGVRFMRAMNAIEYDKLPSNGKFGEDVLEGSDR